jgi:signal transduction histidine kinase
LVSPLLLIAALLQAFAVAYGVVLLSRRQGATGAWLFLLGAMLSMLVWRVVVVTGLQPPPFFNPLIAIWGSTCMVGAMFLFGREVTMRRRVEVERDALLASERAAREDAERASRLKDEFLATVSHELRTPLTAIVGWCSVMRHARARPEQTERAIETIERNALAQARLIDDLLDMTRMQAGTLQLDLATIALPAPVRAAVQAVRPAADAKGVSVEFR